MTLLGIYREPEYSPGRHTSNDARILQLVGQALERMNVPVQLAALEEARDLRKGTTLIFSMCQGPEALAELIQWKKQGAMIFNDPAASRRTYRDALCAMLRHHKVPFPSSTFLPTDGSVDLDAYQAWFEEGAAWLKRSDVHATQPTDVVRLNHWRDLAPALKQFQARGLRQAMLQEHREGDEVKFYAVRGGRFFWPYYPKDSQGYPFDENVLKAMAEAAAKALEIDVYGGDAIIAPDGTITIIDLNDWPSFAPCRGAGAQAIANHLKEVYESLRNRRETEAVRR